MIFSMVLDFVIRFMFKAKIISLNSSTPLLNNPHDLKHYSVHNGTSSMLKFRNWSLNRTLISFNNNRHLHTLLNSCGVCAHIFYILLYFSLAGTAIAQLTDVSGLEQCEGDGRSTVFSDRTGMVKAARMLLSSVTKVLVLADCIVIKQIISSRNKVRIICCVQVLVHWPLQAQMTLLFSCQVHEYTG